MRKEAVWMKRNERKMGEEEGLKRFNLRWSLYLSPLNTQNVAANSPNDTIWFNDQNFGRRIRSAQFSKL